MRPHQLAVFHLIQLCDTHTVFVRLDMLCIDVHRNLSKIQIRADSRGSGNACGPKNIQNDTHCEIFCSDIFPFQICGRIDQHFINGIYVDVIRRHML